MARRRLAAPTSSASRLKALILCVGTTFTPAALAWARMVGAKGLQRVYNAPAKAPAGAPQELLIVDPDGYRVCVAAVAPVPGREPVLVDVQDDRLLVRLPDGTDSGELSVRYVATPEYYSAALPSGQPITRVASTCGLNELNIWPWHDCAIGRLCRFCGINSVFRSAGSADLLTAKAVGAHDDPLFTSWLFDLTMAVKTAVTDPIYADVLFPMIISGNLPDPLLDRQADLYATIAREVAPLVAGLSGPEGLVAMTAPPHDLGLLATQRDAGIQTMAINLEAYSPEAFETECPGKHRIGRDRYLAALLRSADVFGHGKAWSNFVLGLEPVAPLLAGCRELAARGVTPGVSVLHFDEGAAIRGKVPPTYDGLISFYQELADIYRTHDLRPYFNSLALRSSLANEAYDDRL
jgi:hypothetical protein